MSEPRHLYDYGERLIGISWGATFILDTRRTRDDRWPKATYVLAGGPEFEALMERARRALEAPSLQRPFEKDILLRDLLVYLGETP